MAHDAPEHLTCQICNRRLRPMEGLPGELVREGVQDVLRRQHPSWDPKGFICFDDLNRARLDYVQGILEEDRGELSTLELDVVRSLREQELLSKDVGREFEGKRTVGERAADRLAEFGGSWAFIISFGVFIAVWIALNTWLLVSGGRDPYPYILLNLVLSCIAAIQAPVIMMSQNRQEARGGAGLGGGREAPRPSGGAGEEVLGPWMDAWPGVRGPPPSLTPW